MNRKALARGAVASVVAAAVGGFALRHATDPGPLPPARGLIRSVRGERIHYLDEGSGPAVVLIHGFAGSTFSWRTVIPLLAEHHRVIALDLPGFGYSERQPSYPLLQDEHARRIAALLDLLGIPAATIVGHSMGGGVALRFALAYPQRTSALVLVASVDASEVAPWQRPGSLAQRRHTLHAVRLLNTFPPLLALVIRRALDQMLHDDSAMTCDFVRGYVRPLLIPGTADCFAQMLRDTRDESPAPIERIARPTLVLAGSEDHEISPATARRIAAKVPGARSVLLEGCGHLVPDECGPRLAAEIHAFHARSAEAPAVVGFAAEGP